MADALRYRAHIDLSRKNSSHSQLILLSGLNKKVLEVGPATGYITEAIRQRGCRVTCIERDPAAAEVAAEFCERMIVGNVEEINFREAFGQDKFDVIMFGDVLEHLVEPKVVLEKVKELIAPEGRVLASVPNVAHGSVRLALLRGEFRYSDLGLLDKTHLRFFTRQTLDELFREAGYTIALWS